MSARVRQIAVSLLLLVGVQWWLIVGKGQFGSSPRLRWYLIAVVLAGLPWPARWIDQALDRLRRPSDSARCSIAMVIAALSVIYLIGTAIHQHRDFLPELHDEFMHLLQMQMLARGKLWMHQHPCADSFESFHIFVKPVYAGIYFPGTSLLMAPTVWLRLKTWIIPVLVCGAAVGLLYRVVAELLDGAAGLLAAFLLISLTDFRYLALAVMSHGFMVFWGLMLVWAFLRWRKNPSLLWTLAVGACAGMAAITRPIDALCYATPVGIAMLLQMRAWPEKKFKTIAVLVSGALPFLLLQAILNIGVTGNVFETPDRMYNDLYTPGISFGFHKPDRNAAPATSLPQRLKYFREFTIPAAEAHQPGKVLHNWVHERLPTLAKYSMPSVLLLILVPAGLLGLFISRSDCDLSLWVLGGMLPLFVIAYMAFAYLLSHYSIVAAPAIILIVLVGVRTVEEAFPRWRAHIGAFATIWILMLSLHALREFNRLVKDDWYDFNTIRFNARLEAMIQGRAIVLWHWNDWNNPHEEPVYNVSVAWPDNARVIRAQDRGEEINRKLFVYYARIQPDRKVYWIDRLDGLQQPYGASSIRYLGNVKDLAGPPKPSGKL